MTSICRDLLPPMHQRFMSCTWLSKIKPVTPVYVRFKQTGYTTQVLYLAALSLCDSCGHVTGLLSQADVCFKWFTGHSKWIYTSYVQVTSISALSEKRDSSGSWESGRCDWEWVSHSGGESSGLPALPMVHLSNCSYSNYWRLVPTIYLDRDKHRADPQMNVNMLFIWAFSH